MVDDLKPVPPLIAIPPDLRTLDDYERRAADHLPAPVWNHIQGGTGAGRSLHDNRAAFAHWRLLPTVLADLRDGSSAVDLFGRTHAAPILLAPVAYQRLAHPEGELIAARAAAALGTGLILSTLSSVSLEHVARAGEAAAQSLGTPSAPLWFQLYLQPDRADSLALVRRAEAAGYQAIVLTVDAAIKRSEFALPPGVDAAHLRALPQARHRSIPGGPVVFGTPLADAAPGWADLAWLRSVTTLPILIKGLIHGPDLERAIETGVDGIILSNHGGRILDVLPAALDILPAAAERIAGRIPILVDGGVRSGTDIAVAIALGASAVLIGRPVLHAMAVAGMAGVIHMLHILRTEFELAMAQLGCRDIEALAAISPIRCGSR